MSRYDFIEHATALEEEIRATNITLKEHQNIKNLKAQGSDGAETEFVDPLKLEEKRAVNTAALSTLYMAQDNS